MVAAATSLAAPVALVEPPAATSTSVKTSADSPATVAVARPAANLPATATEPVPVPSIAVSPARPPSATTTPSLVRPSSTVAPTVSVNLGSARATASANVASPPPAANAAHSVPMPTPPAIPAKNPGILSFLETMRVGGIRLAGGDSKVVIDGHVYRVNNTVSLELGLRLTAVDATALTFVDENGIVYTKAF
jgi:hypothetical protein